MLSQLHKFSSIVNIDSTQNYPVYFVHNFPNIGDNSMLRERERETTIVNYAPSDDPNVNHLFSSSRAQER